MTASRRLLALACAVAALASAIAAGPALAAGNTIINDCQAKGRLTHPYTLSELQHAIKVMPATVKQYTSCFDVIQQALVSARHHNGTAPAGGGSGGGGSFLPTPVIIILVVLILGAVTFGALAIRRRRAGPGEAEDLGEPEAPATTRVMPSLRPEESSADAPTRIDERGDDDREGGRP